MFARHATGGAALCFMLAASTACAVGTSDAEPAAVSSSPLIAAAKLPTGRTFEVYDMGRSALMVERGDANLPATFQPAKARELGETVTQTWARITGTSAPAELSALEARTRKTVASPQAPKSDVGVREVGVKQAALVNVSPDIIVPTCDNKCCNIELMGARSECHMGGHFPWFLFDKEGPSIDLENVYFYSGYACASTPATYYVHFDDLNFNIPMDAGEDLIASDETPLEPNSGTSLVSGVRTVGSGTATYCGTALFDN